MVGAGSARNSKRSARGRTNFCEAELRRLRRALPLQTHIQVGSGPIHASGLMMRYRSAASRQSTVRWTSVI